MQCLSRQRTSCLVMVSITRALMREPTFLNLEYVLNEFTRSVIFEPEKPLVTETRGRELKGCRSRLTLGTGLAYLGFRRALAASLRQRTLPQAARRRPRRVGEKTSSRRSCGHAAPVSLGVCNNIALAGRAPLAPHEAPPPARLSPSCGDLRAVLQRQVLLSVKVATSSSHHPPTETVSDCVCPQATPIGVSNHSSLYCCCSCSK